MRMNKENWDQRYASEEFVYGKLPNVFFKEQLDLISPGRLLLPAEGEGRNAVYAAGLGWEVWAFDQSRAGRDKALKLAHEKNVKINYSVSDIEQTEYPENHFDAMGLIFFHTPESKRRIIHEKLAGYLKKGGTLILEGFSKNQLGKSSGGPADLSMLFSPEDLRKDFGQLEILSLGELEKVYEEGSFHQGLASVVRLVARK